MLTEPEWKTHGDSGAPEITPQQEAAIERAENDACLPIAELINEFASSTGIEFRDARDIVIDILQRWPKSWGWQSCKSCRREMPHAGNPRRCMKCGCARACGVLVE